jgi:hypothetical protein
MPQEGEHLLEARSRSLLPGIAEPTSCNHVQLAIEHSNLFRLRMVFIQFGRAQGCPFLKRVNLNRYQLLNFVLDGEGWIRHHGEPPGNIVSSKSYF